jgi:hypothetical protein
MSEGILIMNDLDILYFYGNSVKILKNMNINFNYYQ